MPAQHFVGNSAGDIVKIKRTFFLGNARVEDDIEQQITEFLADVCTVITLDRVDQLVGFIEGVGGDGLAGLAYIPGTATLRVAQVYHDLQQIFDCIHRLYCVRLIKTRIIPAFP